MAKRTTRRAHHEPPKVWHNQDVVGRPASGGGGPLPQAEAAQGATTGAAAGATRRIVPVAALTADQRERERLIARLAAAEGRVAITDASNALFAAGHLLLDGDQQVHLQLLEHSDEARVCEALHRLSATFEAEAPKRPLVLDARLRRLEEFADEPETRALAAQLRRQVKTIELPPSG